MTHSYVCHDSLMLSAAQPSRLIFHCPCPFLCRRRSRAAACCTVLQRVAFTAFTAFTALSSAPAGSALQCVVVCCSVVQCVAACFFHFPLLCRHRSRVAVRCRMLQFGTLRCSVLQLLPPSSAATGSMLQCVVVCCSVLLVLLLPLSPQVPCCQRVAVCCSA